MIPGASLRILRGMRVLAGLLTVALAAGACGGTAATPPRAGSSSASTGGAATATAAATAASAAAPGQPTAPPPSAAPSPTTAASPPPAGSQWLALGPLDAGRYTTTTFRPTVTLTVGDGWTELFPDDDDEVALDHASGAGFMMTRVTQVVDPDTRAAVAAPDDLVAWFSHHPVLKAGAVQPVMVSGIASRMVTVSSDATVEIFAYPTGNMRIPAGTSGRYFIVPLDGPDLTVIIAGETKTFDRALALAEPIVASLKIRLP
jgi:hypothetical protein